jgi:hypothetical protein
MVTHSELLTLAKDPTLIKGIHTVCDQWCRYCAATAHCLSYRCNPGASQMKSAEARIDEDDQPDDLFERLMAAKCLADAEGRRAPAEIEILLSGDRERQTRMVALRDPLERLGWQYLITAEAYLSTCDDGDRRSTSSGEAPTPFEVFEWYHALVPARIFRAIVSDMEAGNGVTGRDEDTRATAKMALVGLDRSLAALTTLAAEDDDPRLELLASLLRRLKTEVERRFPRARKYLRPGLDAPSSGPSWWARAMSPLRLIRSR